MTLLPITRLRRVAAPPGSRSRPIVAGAVAIVVALLFFFALPPSSTAAPDLLRFVGRFHTLAVHLPIGVLVMVATAEALTMFPRLRERIDPALGLMLPFLVASMVVAFSLGTLLARGGGYPAKLVGLHRTLTMAGVLGAVASMIAWSVRDCRDGRVRRLPYRIALGATLGLLTLGAHFGGSMTHGETYLTRFAPALLRAPLEPATPARPAATAVAVAGEEPRIFGDVVLPVLATRCAECHGSDDAKGGLRLDSFGGMMKGGEDGPSVVAGSAADSALVRRMTLPDADDQHMPPDGRRGPTADEIALIRWWIDRGASEDLRVRDGLVPDDARDLLNRWLGAKESYGESSP